MSRPSQHVDQRMIEAALSLAGEKGVAGLSVRQVVRKAGANLGMFHYHFKTKDEFARRVLEYGYNEFLSQLDLEVKAGAHPLDQMERAWNTMGRFVRDHRQLALTLLRDATNGYSPSVCFLSDTIPRHVRMLRQITQSCRKAGLIGVTANEAMFFMGGTVTSPMLIWTIMETMMKAGWKSGLKRRLLEMQVFSDSSITKRVRLALKALASAKGAALLLKGAAHG